MTIKQHLHNQCLKLVQQKLEAIKEVIQDMQESMLSETKSSAGDKHETGRAMLQLEREKAGNQLAENEKIWALLQKIDPEKTTSIIGLGSVVETSHQHYFIAASLGELYMNSKTYFAISPQTPIAKLLLGKQKNDSILFRELTFQIKKVD